MAKYSFEFKKKVVLEYLAGKEGYKNLANKYRIPAKNNIEKWVSYYQKFGDEGLLRSRQPKNYSFEKKISVIQLYLSSGMSYKDLAMQENISDPSLICTWVNRFRMAGPDALRSRRKGRRKPMAKSKGKSEAQPAETSDQNVSTEYLKRLENENLHLRIENAFLKELRRLRLEDEAKMRERRSSSTVSEENSD
jgi:transposase